MPDFRTSLNFLTSLDRHLGNCALKYSLQSDSIEVTLLHLFSPTNGGIGTSELYLLQLGNFQSVMSALAFFQR